MKRIALFSLLLAAALFLALIVDLRSRATNDEQRAAAMSFA